MDGLEIRGLVDEDIADYTELFNTAEFDDTEFHMLTEEKMRKRIFLKPYHTLDGYFGAFDNQKMVGAGYGRFNPESEEKRAFFAVYILPGYYESEAGKLVFEKILDYLKSHGIQKIAARSYLSNNDKV